jgi:cell division septum initiation protein DivIVA
MSDNKEKKPRKTKKSLSVPEMVAQLKALILDNEEEVKAIMEEIEELKQENTEALQQIAELEKIKDEPVQDTKPKKATTRGKKKVSDLSNSTTLNFD